MRKCNGLLLSVLFLILVLALPSCQLGSVADGAPDVKVELTFQASPPQVGTAAATVKLADKDGKPLQGAAVKLEGNMNHAGMKPSFADAKEGEPGEYHADLELTM